MRDRERKIFWYELRHQLTQLCLYHLAVTAKSRVFAWSLHANKGHNWLDLTAVFVLYFLEQHLFQSLHFCTALSNLIGTWEMKREPFTTYPKWDPSFIHNLLLPKCLHLGSGSWIRIFVFNAYNSGNRGPTVLRRISKWPQEQGLSPCKKSDKNDLKRLGHPTFIRLFKIRFHSSSWNGYHRSQVVQSTFGANNICNMKYMCGKYLTITTVLKMHKFCHSGLKPFSNGKNV